MSKSARERILEILQQSGLALPPAAIAFNAGLSDGYVGRLCGKLSDESLITNVNTETAPYYEITEKGRSELD